MRNNDKELLNGIKQYNFNFIKNYPEKLETEIKDIESKAMNLLMIDGVFITLIITIVFSSTPILIDKIPRLALQILIFLVICYTLHFIPVAIFSIKCFRVKKIVINGKIIKDECLVGLSDINFKCLGVDLLLHKKIIKEEL